MLQWQLTPSFVSVLIRNAPGGGRNGFRRANRRWLLVPENVRPTFGSLQMRSRKLTKIRSGDRFGAPFRSFQTLRCSGGVQRLASRPVAAAVAPNLGQQWQQVLTTFLVACSSDAAVITAAVVFFSVLLSLRVSRTRWVRAIGKVSVLNPSQSAAGDSSGSTFGRPVAVEVGRSRRTLYVEPIGTNLGRGDRPLVAVPDKSSDGERGWNVWQALIGSLLPEGFRDKSRVPPVVSDDYLPFTILHFTQNLVHAAASVIATQSMLIAIGVAKEATVGVSAAVQWVLKDGLGRIAAIIFGSVLGNRYDADPKRWRMRGDVLYTIGVGTEIATRLVPQYFLLVGTAANAIKSVSYMMRLPTAAAIRRHFSLRENFGDLSAKANSQEVLSMLIGTFIGIGFSYVIGGSLRALIGFYIVYVQMFILFNYWSLRVLHMRTLNLQRTLIVMRRYWNSGGVETCSVAVANQAENFLLPSRLGSARRVRFGCRLGEAFETVTQLEATIARQQQWRGQWLHGAERLQRNGTSATGVASAVDEDVDDRYLLSVDARRGRVYIVLHRDANVADELRALMHASYLVRTDWGAPPDLSLDRVRDGYMLACAETPVLVQRMRAVGWNVDEFVHAGGERARAIWGMDVTQAFQFDARTEQMTQNMSRLMHRAIAKSPSSVGSYELLTSVEEARLPEAEKIEDSLSMSPWGPTVPEISFGSELDFAS